MSEMELTPRTLMGPGPSDVPRRILRALGRPTVGHLDPQFLEVMDEVSEGLRTILGTSNRVTFPVSGTGSSGMEAAVVNVVEPGDTVVVGVNGVFGTRIADVSRRSGAEVVEVEAPWGEPVPEGAVLDAWTEHPDARFVALVHAETSTGVRQPLDEVGEELRGSETLFLVDAVTSLGGIPVEVDRRGVDICYSGTQKCLSVPPGLAPITFSERALERIRSRETPVGSWYLDVSLIERYWGEERLYHHTAPVNMMYALHEGLRIVEEEGLETRYRRHERLGRRLQEELVERGFELFAAEGYRLPQLTSAALPGGREEGPVRRALLERHGIEVGGGLGPAKGKIWRVGLMGSSCTEENVGRFLSAVDELLAGSGGPGI